ncbi:MAG TPA: ATP-binding protein, partial [Candidatus Dormibacteraeota bacterium]
MIAPILSPVMVGRDDELARLEDALLSARRGEGRIVVLCGDAGVGKSRLASELKRRAVLHGCTVLAGECSEADLALPYLPFIEAIGNSLDSATVTGLGATPSSEATPLASLFPQLGTPARSPD